MVIEIQQIWNNVLLFLFITLTKQSSDFQTNSYPDFKGNVEHSPPNQLLLVLSRTTQVFKVPHSFGFNTDESISILKQ